MRDAGSKPLRVTIQAKGEPDIDDSGFPIDTWVDLVTNYPAGKRTLTGAEVFRAGRESAATMVVFVVPYRADLDPDVLDLAATRRVVDRGRSHDVVWAEPEGAKSHVRLACQSGAAAGAAAAGQATADATPQAVQPAHEAPRPITEEEVGHRW